MTITLADLLTAQTAEEKKAALLTRFAGDALPISDWETGGTARTLTEIFAEMLAEADAVTTELAEGANPELATSDWLTYVAHYFFELDRVEAAKAQQSIVLTCAGGAGPYSVGIGEMMVSDASGHRFSNVAAFTLSSASPVTATFEAEIAGSAYNVSAGQITSMVTSYAGVTCTNPASDYSDASQSGYGQGTVTPTSTGTPGTIAVLVKIIASGQTGAATFQWRTSTTGWSATQTTAASFALSGCDTTIAFADAAGVSPSFIAGDVYAFSAPGSPLLVIGAPAESDESLRQRCRDRWPAIGANLSGGKLRLWSMAACSSVTHVSATASGYGAIILTIANDLATLSAGDVAAVQAYIDARLDIGDTVTVYAATPVTILPTGTIQVTAANLAAAQAAFATAWLAYLQGVGIGGKVYVAEFVQAAMDAGATDCIGLALNGASTYVELGTADIALDGAHAGITWSVVG